jgi:hypothetical protein
MFPGFFRVHGFRWIIQGADSEGLDVDHGLGHAIAAETMIEADPRVLQVVTPPFRSEADVTAWLQTTIKLFGMSTLTAEAGR